ncbi:hypothetical protein M8J76_015282 [Diaphorina citri]|nr:hypothetical protein M8J76_015282 [Diaphorina citri]
MKSPLQVFVSLVCLLVQAEHALSTPLPRPHHEIHVDLIDSIFQIPIQTINAVGNLLKNVHQAKRNFLTVNVQIDHPGKPSGGSYHPTSSKPVAKPGYPDSKPGTPSESGFPDYQPDYNPVIPDSSSARPVSGTTSLSFPDTKPEAPDTKPIEGSESSAPSDETTSGDTTFVTDLQTASSVAPPYRPAPAQPDTNQRVPPAPAVQPPYTRTPNVQPLSIDVGGNFDKPSYREKNFKDYVQRKLAEKNLQDNRISHTF